MISGRCRVEGGKNIVSQISGLEPARSEYTHPAGRAGGLTTRLNGMLIIVGFFNFIIYWLMLINRKVPVEEQ